MAQYSSTPKSTRINDNCGGYYEFLPASYNQSVNSQARYPLLIDIAGSGGEGDGSTEDLGRIVLYNTPYFLYNNLFPDTIESGGKGFSFIVMAPQFASRGSGQDVKDAIDFFIAQYRVDTTRIYVTGFSNGGQPTWAYPCTSVEMASKIAALVPVAGVNTNADHTGADNIANTKLPVWALHSTQDLTVPFSRSSNFVNAINSYNPSVPAIISPLSGTHSQTWKQVYNPESKFTVDDKTLSIYEWMLQYNRVQEILPAKLVLFKGVMLNNGNVQLDWSVEQERSNDFFKLEKSKDSFSFIELAKVRGMGNNDARNDYRFIDDKPLEGISYYRLSQVDLNGKQTFFPVIKVHSIVLNPIIKVYPTILQNDLLRVAINNVRVQTTSIRIIDINGRIIFKQTGNFLNEHIISSDKFSLGLNIVEVTFPGDPGLNRKFRVIRLQ